MDKKAAQYQAGLKRLNHTMKYDGKQRIELLNRIVERLYRTHPHQTVIRVCGTNGKTSTSNMVNNVLMADDRRVGLFTTPYLIDPREQITLNQVPITEHQFVDAKQVVQRTCQELGYDLTRDISEFEGWFLIALQFFITQKAQFIILECGMGGEFDATNAIDHSDYSFFTLIGMDHFKFLGNTLEAIATTKANMIRQGEQVITCANQRPVVNQILKRVAAERGASLHSAGEVSISEIDPGSLATPTKFTAEIDNVKMQIELQMMGDPQIKNAQSVIEWWHLYNSTNAHPIKLDALQLGIQRTTKLGRFSRLANGWIIDGAHNLDAINSFVATTNFYFKTQPKLIMVGFLADKEVKRCVAELQQLQNATFVTITPANHDRALPSAELLKLFQAQPAIQAGHNRVIDAHSIERGTAFLAAADSQTQKIVVGSFYNIKDVVKLIAGGI
ncbi:Mur ligase family protein [Nicoliella spurrieriana]|uniref:Mur ligase family protein n=1 Tax=Nicoliella spurrieriana TaxID=2925830 RepID=A0A976RRZ2_9LACO|nr:Mur ligase family protein [Nicoliella spurrieriana]UQS86737.1 Mur ligase family protein [Nicoliella spurrieriana]